MLTEVFKISSCSDIETLERMEDLSSAAFRFLFVHFDKTSDKLFLDQVAHRFNLDVYSISIILKDVEGVVKSRESINKNKEELVCYIEQELEQLRKELKKDKLSTKKRKSIGRKIFKLEKKLRRTTDALNNNIVFGGRKNLSDMSKAKNANDEDAYVKAKQIFDTKRNRGILLGGEAHHNGNRYINFDLENDIIVYKPRKGVKIEIKLQHKFDKKKVELMKKLQYAADNCLLPITIRIANGCVYISYDETTLYGNNFDKNGYNREKKAQTKDITDEAIKKEISSKIRQKFIEEYNYRIHAGKIVGRVAAIDVNPDNVGLSIIEYNPFAKSVRVLFAKMYDMKALCGKTGLASDHPDTIKLNNKRENELCLIYKDIFKLCKHYKAYRFCTEELNFDRNSVSSNHEFNRKVMNIWNLDLQKKLIKKHTNILGMELVEVPAFYTSLIGNFLYNYVDCVAASIEIGRRGILKYVQGSSNSGNTSYPEMTDSLKITMSNHLDFIGLEMRDGFVATFSKDWPSLYKAVNDPERKTKLGYRRRLEDCKNYTSYSLNSSDRFLTKTYVFY